MKFEIINRREKDEIISQLNKQFGISSLPFLLIRQGKEKIRAYSGSLSCDELSILGENINIDTLGIYLLNQESSGEFRLSHDAVSTLQSQITKNIIELNDAQANEWLRGHDLIIKTDLKGIVVLKCKQYMIGCGKSSGERVTNFVPKERRIRN